MRIRRDLENSSRRVEDKTDLEDRSRRVEDKRSRTDLEGVRIRRI